MAVVLVCRECGGLPSACVRHRWYWCEEHEAEGDAHSWGTPCGDCAMEMKMASGHFM